MRDIIKWPGGTAEVQARLIPRLLWTTATIEVFVDGRCVLETGGQLKFTGSNTAAFAQAGVSHSAELIWGPALLRWIQYRLRINGAPVGEGRVYVQNWAMAVIPLVVVLAASACALRIFLAHLAALPHG